jgi:uncharacterized membrane protein (DUF485 family)
MALIGDRERERAALALREHYLRGRLSVEELTDRLEVALAARRDTDVRQALDDLPSTWRPPALARKAKRVAVIAAVWFLWWTVSLILLVGFVTSVALDGLDWTNGILFPALWLLATLLARRAARSAGSEPR